MKAARHVRIAFDVFEFGIYKRRLLEGDTEESDDWTTGHPILFPNTLANGMGLQIRVPVDDAHTLHILYQTRPRGPEEPPSVDVYDLPDVYEDGRRVVETVIGTDMTAWVTQGEITPRHLEHLGVSDKGVILYRRMLNEAMDAVARGEDPPGLLRDPARNYPWIDIKREGVARAAFVIPGTDRYQLVRDLGGTAAAGKARGTVTPRGT